MPVVVPFTSEDPRYELRTVLDENQYRFNVRWNSREESWYFDLFFEEEELVVRSVKMVIGAALGNVARGNPLFPRGMFVVADLTNEDREATIDDLGTRVVVYYFSEDE